MDLLDTVDTEDETPLSSRIRVTHVDTRHRWNRRRHRSGVGRFISRGPREFVAVLPKQTERGLSSAYLRHSESPAVVAGAGAADGANPLLRRPHLSCPLGGSFSS